MVRGFGDGQGSSSIWTTAKYSRHVLHDALHLSTIADILLFVSPFELSRSGVHRNKHHRRQVYDRSKRAWVPAELKYAAIIYVNKQVYVEASDILYAVNCFKFATTAALRDIIPVLGRRAHLLRYIDIEVGEYRIKSAPEAFTALSVDSNLKKLQISHFDVCTERTDFRGAK